MRAKLFRILGFVGLAGGVVLAVGGCFFISAPTPAGPALIFSDLLGPVGEEAELTVEVAGMPPVSGLAVFGFRYDPQKFRISAIQGKNGFEVLCCRIDNTAGEVRFVAVNPAAGWSSGVLAVLRGERLAPGDPGFILAADQAQVVSEANVLIPSNSFAIKVGGAPLYYVVRSSTSH